MNDIGQHFKRCAENSRRVDRRKLEYVLSKTDPVQLLMSLGIKFIPRKTSECIMGWCPDHFKYVNRVPSHAKWMFNYKKGTTYCFTEGRKSDILRVILNITNLNTEEDALNYIIGKRDIVIPSVLKSLVSDNANLIDVEDEKRKKKLQETLCSLESVLNDGYIGEMTMEYFAKSNISLNTLKKFGVVEITTGKYRDRSLMPFYDITGKLIGFGAVSLLNKKQWIRSRLKRDTVKTYSELIKYYRKLSQCFRKVLFCPGANLSGDLYGLNMLIGKKDFKEVILVEGEKDVLKLQQEGFYAVGTHGNHLTIDQVELLYKNGIMRVIVAFDGDKGGRDATKNIMKNYNDRFESLKVLDIGEGKNPKDFDGIGFSKLLDQLKTKNDSETKTNYWGINEKAKESGRKTILKRSNDKVQV